MHTLSFDLGIILFFFARLLNLAAMNDLRSGIKSKKIGNVAHSGVSEVFFFTNLTSGRNNGERSGQLEDLFLRRCALEDFQRYANWLTD